MAAATRTRWQQLREGLDEWRGIRADEDVLEDVRLSDPDQEQFLERLDAIKRTLGRCMLVGFPTWIAVLAIYPLVLPSGPLMLGLGLATLIATGACVWFEWWWRGRRPSPSAGGASRRRGIDPRTAALIAIGVFAVIAVYVIFVLAVSR